jgi:hypothetical protein
LVWLFIWPDQPELGLPEEPQHLRIRDVQAQAEIATILDVMQREQTANRPFADTAMRAQAMLMSVWLRRQMMEHMQMTAPASLQRIVWCRPIARWSRAITPAPN